jgi:hypothetical protein
MSAQEADKYYVEIGSAIGLMSLNDSDDELVTRDFAVSFGYDFSKRFTAKIPLTLSTGLFKNDKSGVKSYETTGTIGVGAGYNIVVKPSYKLQLSGEIGNTLSGDDDKWNFFYYDAGCKFYLGKTTDRVNAIAGLGVKQMFTDEKSSVDFAVPYVSIGFRLNKFKRK